MTFLGCCTGKKVITKQGETGPQGPIGPPGPTGLTGATGATETATNFEVVDDSVINIRTHIYDQTLGNQIFVNLDAGKYLVMFTGEVRVEYFDALLAGFQVGKFSFYVEGVQNAASETSFKHVNVPGNLTSGVKFVFNMQKIIDVVDQDDLEVRYLQFSANNGGDIFSEKGIFTLIKLS